MHINSRAVSKSVSVGIIIVVIVVAAILAYVVSPRGGAPAPSASTTSVAPSSPFTFAASEINSPVYAAWVAGRQNGIFAKYAPSATLQELSTGTSGLVSLLVSGTVNVAIGGTADLMTGIAKGADIKIVASFLDSPFKFVMIVNANSTYHTIGDLVGKLIGTTNPGSSSYSGTLLIIKRYNYTVNDFKINPLGSIPADIAALKSGTVPAIVASQWSFANLIASGEARAVASVDEPWPALSVVASSSYIASHPQEVRQAVLASEKAASLYNNNKTAGIQALESRWNLSPQVANFFYGTLKYSEDGAISKPGLTNAANFLLENKLINAPLDISKVYVTDFAKETA